MPTITVKQLISNWLQYLQDNNIASPEDTDLSGFLKNAGFDINVFGPLISDMPELGSPDKPELPVSKPTVNTSEYDKEVRARAQALRDKRIANNSNQIKDSEPEPDPEPDPEPNEQRYLSDDQVDKLNKIKQVIKNDMDEHQRQALHRELTNG